LKLPTVETLPYKEEIENINQQYLLFSYSEGHKFKEAQSKIAELNATL
jgi:hypothetical protein